MRETRDFPARVVLSVTTGRLLTRRRDDGSNGIQDIYELLQHMTGENPWTHQLPRFAAKCKPWLLKWHPQLALADDHLDDLDQRLKNGDADTAVELWLNTLPLEPHMAVSQIPKRDHVSRDPIDELVEMRGTTEGVVVAVANCEAEHETAVGQETPPRLSRVRSDNE
jgi:hypothetical protein